MKQILLTTVIYLTIIMFISCGEKMTEDELSALAQDYQKKDQPQEAIKVYKELIKEFPQSSQRPYYMFSIGFLYANVIKDYEKARKYYTEFKEKYPEHELVKNRTVDFELENMGKEIILPEDQETTQ